ncbi:hypothetical protein P3T23_004078 [Paraburkholderia sp. GAS448]|jgi:hypothetical protein|uniref:hypothetical protein n=1 Tax=Paraburkholderia sp. GAS448 TaxID=3035136 RepID=UPI003D258237
MPRNSGVPAVSKSSSDFDRESLAVCELARKDVQDRFESRYGYDPGVPVNGSAYEAGRKCEVGESDAELAGCASKSTSY